MKHKRLHHATKRMAVWAVVCTLTGVTLTLGIACLRAYVYDHAHPSLVETTGIYKAGDGRLWMVYDRHRTGITALTASIREARDLSQSDLPRVTMPAWSSIHDTPTFKSGFHYDLAFGWPLPALAWSARLSRDHGLEDRLQVTSGIVLSNNPNDTGVAASLRVLPYAPIWRGLLLDTALFASIAALAGLAMKGYLALRRSYIRWLTVRRSAGETTDAAAHVSTA